MKMTMHIDDALLKRVMETYELETKTDAVHFALRELDRRARLKGFMKDGLGLTKEELKDAVFPGYDPDAPRKIAEEPPPYGTSRPH
jgi:Arc/MetJ family transcription regulator